MTKSWKCSLVKVTISTFKETMFLHLGNYVIFLFLLLTSLLLLLSWCCDAYYLLIITIDYDYCYCLYQYKGSVMDLQLTRSSVPLLHSDIFWPVVFLLLLIHLPMGRPWPLLPSRNDSCVLLCGWDTGFVFFWLQVAFL